MIQRKKTCKLNPILPSSPQYSAQGFTLIELLIVIAVIAIIMTLAIPTYSSYSIRTKIGKTLAQIEEVKAATNSFCQKDRTITELNNGLAGYDFVPSKYVKYIEVGGACEAPIITMTTKATGAKPDHVLTITGNFDENTGEVTWTCMSSGLNIHLPESCRS